ncbi:MAG: hypothetical protein HZC12_02580, partial [Nitrospirae bacterium]|nr:hypothetical protein [Nitrospirota bacterium]
MSEKKSTYELLREHNIFPPPGDFQKKAHIKDPSEYERLYKQSFEEPEKFWANMAEDITWFKKWD